MHRDQNADTPRVPIMPAALDAGATIQHAVVRRLRFIRAASDGPTAARLEDRPPVGAVVGRRP
jgi:hypothetical protein